MPSILNSKNKKNQAMVRVGPLINIPLIIKSLGYDPELILTSSGFKLSQFEDPDTRISFLAGSKLLARCVEITDCQSFGLLLGQHAKPSHLGVVGFLIPSAPNVGEALNSLVRYLCLHDQGGMVTIETYEGTTEFGYVIRQPGAMAVDQIYDLSMVIACNIMRTLCGEKWNPKEVSFMRKEPEDLTPYQVFFQAPIRFHADKSAIIFDKDWLEHSLPLSDPFLQQHLQKEAEELLLSQDTNFLIILERLMHQCLINQQCSARNLAKRLGMHERTLHRRLEHFGTNFRRELEQRRFSISRQLLTETNEQIINIAVSLGYSNSSAFTRAFKQWSGKSPSQWRKDILNKSENP